MAVDTKTKRASVQAYTVYGSLPVPDSTVAEGDRAHVQGLFSGMDYETPAVAVIHQSVGYFIGLKSVKLLPSN